MAADGVCSAPLATILGVLLQEMVALPVHQRTFLDPLEQVRQQRGQRGGQRRCRGG